jgi:hypothetical protein
MGVSTIAFEIKLLAEKGVMLALFEQCLICRSGALLEFREARMRSCTRNVVGDFVCYYFWCDLNVEFNICS